MHSSVLESGIDNQAVLQLQRLTREALSNVCALQSELAVLDTILNDSETVASCLPVDLIFLYFPNCLICSVLLNQ
jgi:hypothetical protein